jgi:autotransporter adhesin
VRRLRQPIPWHLGANSVASTANSISIGSVGNERTIGSLAPGINGTDAVNVNQLNAGVGSAVTQANQYTNSQVQSVRNDANGGTASAMAVAGLPQPSAPGKSMVSIASSVYQGQTGYALGVSTITAGGRWAYKASLTSNSRGATGGVVGAGYEW